MSMDRSFEAGPTRSISSLFGEYLTESARTLNDMLRGRARVRPSRGIEMHFEAEGNRRAQLMALLMTVAVVGGTIVYAMAA